MMEEAALAPLEADDWDEAALDVPPEARADETDTLTLAIDGW